MASEDFLPETRSVQLEVKDLKDTPFLLRAHVREGFSEVSEITAEFLIKNRAFKLEDLVGKDMMVHLKSAEVKTDEILRTFSGVCVSAEYVGELEGFGHYMAEIRPWLWFLSRTRDCRIFQGKTVVEIIREVFSDLGFNDYQDKLSGSYPTRNYCVQYRETDLDFVHRLMEEEGIYYFFDNSKEMPDLILADGEGAHSPTPNTPKIPFHGGEHGFRNDEGYIFDWQDVDRQVPGKVTLRDYDFNSPTADQTKVSEKKIGKHSYNDSELYDYPGHYRESIPGDPRARVRMEAQTVKASTRRGGTSERNLTVGAHFELEDGPLDGSDGEFLVTGADHWLQVNIDPEDPRHSILRQAAKIALPDENEDTYRAFFSAIPRDVPFRAPLLTPWPEIAGLHTAIVTGPSGEEIHTDEFGRIKVKFHWDRSGGRDQHSSCWVRTVMPWTGKNWGMIAIPRIGQEVVIQFEEGDPDRPICTGMLYNGDTMPPYALPANKTMTGMTTRSTTEGSANTFHELVFEDKKGSEYVRFQSERDYHQIIKNNATIDIGQGWMQDGDLTQKIHRNKTEVIGLFENKVVGVLRDVSVGTVSDEAVGFVKQEAIGQYKVELVGLSAKDALGWGLNSAALVATLSGNTYAGLTGSTATAAFGLLGGAKKVGKAEIIRGNSDLIVSKGIGAPGDRNVKVEDGHQEVKIEKGNRSVVVDKGNLHTNVGEGNYTVDIMEGSHLTHVKKGNLVTEVDTKDYKEQVKKGDYSLKCDMGKIEIEAMKSITLKVGTSKILIDQKGVTITGNMLKFDATAVASLEGPMVKVSADSICTVDGTPVLIN